MKKLVVDSGRMELALTCRDIPSFFDRETGHVSLLGFYTTLSPEEYVQYVEDIYSHPERYLRITPMTVEAWAEFTDTFISSLPADDAALLRRSFGSVGTKEAAELMEARPELFESWMEYREGNLAGLARQWLGEHQIEAELSSGYEA